MPRRIRHFLPLLAAFFTLAAVPAAASAHSVHWHGGVRIEPTADGGLTSVSCASAKLCVAGDQSGNVLWSTAPTSTSTSAWHGALVDKYGGITGMSCPTLKYCFAVDDSGVFIYSNNPTGGAVHWSHPARVDKTTYPGGGYVGFDSISCPSTTLCVAADSSPRGAIWYSADPTGGASTWHSTTFAGPITSVSCPTTTFCEAVGYEKLYSTDPSNPNDWHASDALSGSLFSAVSCQTPTLCVAVGYGDTGAGFSLGSRTPTGTWGAQAVVGSSVPNYGAGVLDTVGCTEGTCVTIDSSENYWATSGVVNGSWNGGTEIRNPPSHISNVISCKDLICVVVDSAGVETTGVL